MNKIETTPSGCSWCPLSGGDSLVFRKVSVVASICVWSCTIVLVLSSLASADPEGGGGQAFWTPLEYHKLYGFL